MLCWERHENQSAGRDMKIKKAEKEDKVTNLTPQLERQKSRKTTRLSINISNMPVGIPVGSNGFKDRSTQGMLRTLDEMRRLTMKSAHTTLKGQQQQENQCIPRRIKEQILTTFLYAKRKTYQEVLADKKLERSMSAEWSQFEKKLGFGVVYLESELDEVLKTLNTQNHTEFRPRPLMMFKDFKKELPAMRKKAMKLWTKENETHHLSPIVDLE